MADRKPQTLDVTIMGRSYKVTCQEEEQDALMRAVAFLDEKMSEIRDSGRVGNVERIAVMAALNIAHEFLTSRVSGEFDVATLKGRIERMQSTLDEALAPQQALF